MLINKLRSKIQKSKTYDKAVNNAIYRQQWQKAIKEELQNLENYQTQEYDELPQEKKAIRSK